MIRRLPVLLALLVLLVAVPWKALRLLPRLIHQAHTPSELFNRPAQHETFLRLKHTLHQARTAGDTLPSVQLSERLTGDFPKNPESWFEAALTAAAAGSHQQALLHLQHAASLGFSDSSKLNAAPELLAISNLPGFKETVAEIQKAATQSSGSSSGVVATPDTIQGTTALVTDRNTRWDPDRLMLTTEFRLPAQPPSPPGNCSLLDTSAARLVNAWVREGSAAGLHGILYDNRDRGHSTLDRSTWPELVFVRYSPEIRAAGGDYSFRPWQRFNLPTFGNASTALVTPLYWRSNPRTVLSNPLHTALILDHYLNNQLYCAPEHNDFDPEYGDLYPANAPCWVISQGSSGSDQPFLQALALTLAAFPPDTRKKLERDGLLMHAVQWTLRQSLRNVETPEDFFTGLAHPAVLREQQLNPERMVQLAHEMSVRQIPPLVHLQVLQESTAKHGIDYFSGGPTEEFITHPLLVARIHRTVARKRSLVVQASCATTSATTDSAPPTFRWAVLQGNPEFVEIQPLNPQASIARLTFTWNSSHPVRSAPELACSRVDVGAFTEVNGVPSMPSIISSFTLATEDRQYDGDQLVSIDYAAPRNASRYSDPLLVPTRNWKDTLLYHPDGKCSGWIRQAPGQPPHQFTASGELAPDPALPNARPTPVLYRLQQAPEQPPELVWQTE